jgi:cobalt-zinc-cadmium efflux system outer membrane protein
VRIALERHPRLAKAQFAIDAANGRYVQAGLYPNPVLQITGDEISDRTGPAGIWTAPYLTQEIVRGKKLSLSQAVAAAEVDQATLALLAERYAVVANVRGAFFEALVLQERVAILDRLAQLSDEVARAGRDQLANKQISELDLVQLEVIREKYRADAESARRELPPTYRRLAAAAGDPATPVAAVTGALDTIPQYDLDRIREIVLASHPDLRVASVGVEHARAAARRAEAEAISNVSLSAGYTYQGQNRSNDWAVGFSMPLPLWNRQQGNIRAANAELGAAIQDVGRVENELSERLANTFRVYAAGAERAGRYRVAVLPRARQAAELSLKAVKLGQFNNLKMLEAQRALAEAALEENKSLADAWKSAAELSGLLLEESWPPRPAPPGPEVAPPPR